MTAARKRARLRHRFARIGRLLLAAGLLAALGWAAFQAANRSTDASDRGRRADRLQVTQSAAASMAPFMQAGLDEARSVAAQARVAGGEAAVASYSAQQHVFREAFVVSRSLRRLAGNQRYADPAGRLLTCGADQSGLSALAVEAVHESVPVLGAFEDPSCVPVVAAAAVSGDGPVAVVLSDPAPLTVRLDVAARLKNGQALLMDPAGTTLDTSGRAAPGTAPLNTFFSTRRTQAGISDVETDAATVVRAWAPLPAGWVLVVDQAKADFAPSAATQSANWFPAGVAAAFAIAIFVVGVFDSRRRRALAKAEIDRADFLAIVGHELRTPITVLKGFIDTLTARWESLDDERRHTIIERLPTQVRRLNQTVDRLLVAADIQAGVYPRPSNEPLEMGAVLEDVAAGFRPLAPLHSFEVDVPDELIVMADRKALTQVLDQLVDNAVKYSPSGGPVTLAGQRRRGRVELSVDDEGIGLPSDVQRIFDAFTQGEDVDRRTHDEGGVGVGLFIARTLTEAMGGTVRAERRATGTRLVVTLLSGPGRQRGDAPLAPPARVHGQS